MQQLLLVLLQILTRHPEVRCTSSHDACDLDFLHGKACDHAAASTIDQP